MALGPQNERTTSAHIRSDGLFEVRKEDGRPDMSTRSMPRRQPEGGNLLLSNKLPHDGCFLRALRKMDPSEARGWTPSNTERRRGTSLLGVRWWPSHDLLPFGCPPPNESPGGWTSA